MYTLYSIERRRNGDPEVEGGNQGYLRFKPEKVDEKKAAIRKMFADAVKKSTTPEKGELSFLVYLNGAPIEGACVHNLTEQEYNDNQKRINRATEAWADLAAAGKV